MRRAGLCSAALISVLFGSQLPPVATHAQEEKQGEVQSPATPSEGGSGYAPADLTADQVIALEQKADALYEKGDYAASAELYESIVYC